MIPGHVQRAEMVKRLRRLADLIDDGSADKAMRNAKIHADAIGFPTGTLGDGTSRSTDSTSSTERAALPRHPDPTLYDHAKMRERSLLLDRILGEVLNLVGQWTPDAREDTPKQPLAKFCSNPRCPFGDIPLARFYGGRHRRCYDFWRVTGRDLSIDDVNEDGYRQWAAELNQRV